MASKSNKNIAIVLFVVAGLIILGQLIPFLRISNLDWIIALVNIAIGIYLLVK